MKRRTWLAALVALCMLALPAALASEADAGEIFADFSGETATEIYEDIDAEPVDEIGAEAVEQDIDAVTMDLDGDDAQSALLVEYSAVEADAVPDNNESDTGEVAAPDDAPTGDESDAGETPAPDKDESDAGEVVAADDNSAAEEPAPPADPIIASLEPVAEQVSTAAMFTGPENNGSNTPISIADATVTCNPETYTYDGTAKTPGVTVKLGETELGSDDYTVSYTDNINAGTRATVTVTGTGNYTGTAIGTFTINKADCEVEVKLKSGKTITKVYDKTRNLKVTSSDFEFSPDKQLTTDRLIFASIRGSYSNYDVGNYDISITFTINQEGRNYNYKLKNGGTFSFPGTITPKQLTIKPGVEQNGTLVPQTKVYGTVEPEFYLAKVIGIMGSSSHYIGDSDLQSDIVSGMLSREPGENVGNYVITIGTIQTHGNYATEPILEEGYFEITPKPITDTDIGIASIPDQHYTASPIEPAITVRYGSMTLVQGTDFDVVFSDNILPGTATATITGKGNYTGTRTATFRIMKTSSSNKSSSSSSISRNKNSNGSDNGGSNGNSGSDPSNVLEHFPIVTNGKYVVSAGSTFRLNLGNLSARSFKSSNKKVASVDRNGIVTTKKAGKAKITITLGKKTKIKLKLTVIDPTIPTSVSLAPVNTAVKKGDVVTLTPGVPENANPGGYKWKSSNKKVATVKNGVVTFKKPGKVTITCTAKRGKKKARVKFRVSK